MILFRSKLDNPFLFLRTLKGLIFSILLVSLVLIGAIYLIFFSFDSLALQRESRLKQEVAGDFQLSYFKPVWKQDYFTSDLEALNRSVSLVAINNHPVRANKNLLLKIGRASAPLEVELDRRVYLSFEQKEAVISDVPTPLWVKPVQVEGVYRTELDFWLPLQEEDRVISSKSSHLLHQMDADDSTRLSWGADPISEKAVQVLRRGQWLGVDCFFELYGGAKYRQLAGKERVVFGDADMLFIEDGDCIFWDGDGWKIGVGGGAEPVAKISKAKVDSLCVDVFGMKGFFHYPIYLSRFANTEPKSKIGEIISSIHPRTRSKISCQLNKKTALLSEGDWIVQRDGLWVILKSASEIENFISMQSSGELLVFDRLEKQSGESIFHGKLFNDKRTAWKSVQIASEKKIKTPVAKPRSHPFMPPAFDDDDFDDDFDDDDDDFNDENSDYFRFMNNGPRHDVPPSY